MAVAIPENLTWSDVRVAVNRLAQERGEWGGYPTPIEGRKLIMEPRFPLVKMNGFALPRSEPEKQKVEPDDDYKCVNSWFSLKKNSWVYVVAEKNGRRTSATWSKRNDITRSLMDRIEVTCQAWDLDAELEAQEKLYSLITPHAWKCYSMTGMFLESSQRSGVTYLFRRLATTVAIGKGNERMGTIVLATLCLHPIGYYDETVCGVMVPTDDVIAHLVMMRGDEHYFWRKANQKPIWQEGL